MLPIHIDFVPVEECRYGQVGDYGMDEDRIWFKITLFEDKPAYSMAILIHELWEKFRNDQAGIPDELVDNFDRDNPDLDDPGLSLDAPYHKQHMESDALERMCIVMAGEDWAEYENAINALFEGDS